MISQEPIHIADLNCYAYWRHNPQQYVPQTILYVGNIEVARYFHDSAIPKTSPLKYKAITGLPSIRREIGKYETEKQCQEACLSAVKSFFELLQRKGGDPDV